MKRFDRRARIQQIAKGMTLPRVQMFIILAFAGITGFSAPLTLLRLGLDSMALRYPLAIAVAYGTFLLLLKAWIKLQADDVPDLDVPIDGGWPTGSGPRILGNNADYSGAGAGSGWDAVGVHSGDGSAQGSGFDFDSSLDLDDLGTIILAIAAVFAAIAAVFYVIYVAPVLLAEILIDAAVVGGLYRSMRGVERCYWLSTALRKTAVPAVLAAVLFGAAGYLLQSAVPEASSVAEVWSSLIG